MNILDLIQTACAIIALILSAYSVSEINKLKKTVKIDTSIKNVKQSISGNNNFQNIGNKINTEL